jgi:oligoendopeptidase F
MLGVQYDLAPRDGKSPVAFTQFGGMPRRTRAGPHGADPVVFATYREGGLGNLVELLHETGHAIHIAAIETRPAFAGWPDSDPFTEALADVPAFEAWEGAWQLKYLGDSARTEESLREKYAGVMLDVAWALFELRMYRDPSQDPNAVWTAITERYLRIAPHPEWSWWAMRGQLVDSPGYMMNYALGALVVADLRAQVAKEKGGFLAGGARLYDWLADRLYRFGREKPAREVVEGFLGRPVGAAALIRDLGRIGSGG